MNTKKLKTIHETGDPPSWLVAAVRSYHSVGRTTRGQLVADSDPFRERCRMAALLALDLARMRAGRKKEITLPDALLNYFRELAKRVGANWQRITAGCGINQAEPMDALVGLAVRIGMGIEEAEIRLRSQLAISYSRERLEEAFALGRRQSDGDPWEDCEAVLATLESKYDRNQRVKLNRAMRVLRQAYAEECVNQSASNRT
jgi:hypothetical protein